MMKADKEISKALWSVVTSVWGNDRGTRRQYAFVAAPSLAYPMATFMATGVYLNFTEAIREAS